MRRSSSQIALRALVASVLLGVAACDAPPAQAPGRPLPSYTGRSAELFDDSIDPVAVGITLEARVSPRGDHTLRERTQVGDAVVRVRATTVTAKQEDSGTRYVIGLHTLENLAGRFPPGETFEVSIGQLNPSAGILKTMESAIIGKSFVAFVRTFVRADGDQEIHFHFAPDSKEEIAAVKDAAVLAGL